ncbi:MAG: 50S ribosomal protein L17 [Verrucomicrobiales bacterium]|nr:50S ribosomal protein L17 [Verrucomicrobiales bacterium]MEC5125149.1 50S ribosomal protein L17 [Verrucomicrobiales bacterium BCK34]
MRHRSKTVKLQRDKAHREALLRNLSASLIEHGQIRTTLAKAKALRPFAEKLVTLGKKNTLHSRRRALTLLGSNQLSQRSVSVLFDTIAPANADRPGGYCRILKLGQRRSDSAPMALIEWVDSGAVSSAAEEVEAAS